MTANQPDPGDHQPGGRFTEDFDTSPTVAQLEAKHIYCEPTHVSFSPVLSPIQRHPTRTSNSPSPALRRKERVVLQPATPPIGTPLSPLSPNCTSPNVGPTKKLKRLSLPLAKLSPSISKSSHSTNSHEDDYFSRPPQKKSPVSPFAVMWQKIKEEITSPSAETKKPSTGGLVRRISLAKPKSKPAPPVESSPDSSFIVESRKSMTASDNSSSENDQPGFQRAVDQNKTATPPQQKSPERWQKRITRPKRHVEHPNLYQVYGESLFSDHKAAFEKKYSPVGFGQLIPHPLRYPHERPFRRHSISLDFIGRPHRFVTTDTEDIVGKSDLSKLECAARLKMNERKARTPTHVVVSEASSILEQGHFMEVPSSDDVFNLCTPELSAQNSRNNSFSDTSSIYPTPAISNSYVYDSPCPARRHTGKMFDVGESKFWETESTLDEMTEDVYKKLGSKRSVMQ